MLTPELERSADEVAKTVIAEMKQKEKNNFGSAEKVQGISGGIEERLNFISQDLCSKIPELYGCEKEVYQVFVDAFAAINISITSSRKHGADEELN